MKGVILDCLSELVRNKLGDDKWIEVLEKAGFSKHTVFLPYHNVPEEYFQRVYRSALECSGLDPAAAADAFGEYWMTVYAPRVYRQHFEGISCARDFLLKMDTLHKKVVEEIPYANPPHFEYRVMEDGSVRMFYFSSRGLMHLFEALVKGTARHFNEEVRIERVSGNCLHIFFER